MSTIVYTGETGWVVRPFLYILDGESGSHWPSAHFQVVRPYVANAADAQPLESNVTPEGWTAAEANTATDALPGKKRKRQSKLKLAKHVESAPSTMHLEIRDWLLEAHKELAAKGFLLDDGDNKVAGAERNGSAIEEIDFVSYGELADVASSAQFAMLADESTSVDVADLPPSVYINQVYNVTVFNASDTAQSLDIMNHKFLIPKRSAFIMSDLSKAAKLLSTFNPFHLIVMDPPWPNKSVRRSAKYSEIDIYDLYRIPGKRLIAAGGYVAIWVTNNPKFCKFVYEKLFPTWGLVPVTEWFWLKVTTSGEWVLDLDSPHRKPYERLIIGKASTLATDSSSSLPSARKVICSVPSSHHSRKPFLEDLFVPFLPTNARKLELFARNVLPGWVAWGNEALKFNDTQFLTTMAES